MSDIAGINSLVSDEKMNHNYYSVGKRYVAMYQNNFERNFVGINYINSCILHQNKRG